MAGPLADLANRFRFNDKFVDVLAEKLEEDDWTFRPTDGGSSALWILGHVTATRLALCRRLSEKKVEVAPWESLFEMGSDADGATEGPGGPDLVDEFKRCGEAMTAALESVTEDVAGQPWEQPFPDGSDTVGGAAHFFFFHEVYHLGQLGLIRRMRGKPGFA